MKKIIFSALALLFVNGSVFSQKVTVADVEALPGETVSFSLNLTSGKPDTYTALSFTAHFPTTGFSTTGEFAVSPSWSGATAVVGEVDDMGEAVIPFASANAIEGIDVKDLVSVQVKVDENVSFDEYNVTLSNIMFEYGLSEKDYAEDVSFKIKVVAAHNIELDENSDVLPNAVSVANVRVKRTIKANQWSTICLPFGMSEAQCKAAFGEDVQLADFVNTESTYDASDNVVGISILFDEVAAMEANHPYIIKVSQPVTEFTVDGVDIDPAEEDALVEVDNGQTGRRRVVYGGMYGTYHAATDLEANALFLSDNKFWYSTGLTKMKAFRAYFYMLDVLSDVENASSRIVLNFEDETTGVGDASHLNDKGEMINDKSYYTIEGVKLLGVPSQRGLYIKNGKKVVVK